MSSFYKYKLKLINGDSYEFYMGDKVFVPNLTTILLINAVSNIINNNQKVLDLGCGSGIINSYFFEKKLIKKIYSSDISHDAIECAIFNANNINAPYKILKGELFEPWNGEKFDIIINDISGISAKLTKLTKWFDFAPNNSGDDGINFTLKILNEFNDYLNSKGRLFFPIISLSNKIQLYKILADKNIKYNIIAKKEWPLPPELTSKKDY